MSRLTTATHRNTNAQSGLSPSPILVAPSGPSSSSSGRASPFRPNPAGPSNLGPYNNSLSGRATPYNDFNGKASPYRPGSAASQYSESPFGGGMTSNGSGYTRTTHEVEGQNDDRLEGLLGKVKVLKDITVGIGNEVRDGNMDLSTMNDAFSSTSTFLGGTFKRMSKMAKRQGIGWCWFMGFLLLVLWIFVLIWWLRR